MKTIILLFSFFYCLNVSAQTDTTRTLIYFVNGQPSSIEKVSLLNPKNITNITKVKKASQPTEMRIETKTLQVLTYQDLKKRLHVEADKNPDVVVDDKPLADKMNILIDRTFVKKLRLTDKGSTISITTKAYNGK